MRRGAPTRVARTGSTGNDLGQPDYCDQIECRSAERPEGLNPIVFNHADGGIARLNDRHAKGYR